MGTFTVSYAAKKIIWDQKGYWMMAAGLYYYGKFDLFDLFNGDFISGKCWDKAGMYKAEMMHGQSKMFAAKTTALPLSVDPWKH
uniref:Ntox44 domain-containing protein n=1 Tax=Rhabditophanes sp. KR3021 TaxID=114890 RepID=A0AC35UFI4_9BILA